MENAQPPLLASTGSRRLAVFLKITFVCLLIAFLHIPLGMTHGVLRERQGYQAQATEEIAKTWGQSQCITGPVLVVPWTQVIKRTQEWKDAAGKTFSREETNTYTGTYSFLPDKLAVTGRIEPEIRYRGIYEAVVYAAKVNLRGTFQVNPPGDGPVNAEYHWGKAHLLFGTTDLRRLRAAPVVAWAGAPSTAESNPANESQGIGLTTAVVVESGKETEFSIEMLVQGSAHLEVAPLGRQTSVTLSSSWSEPSFTGIYLPLTRQVSTGGFEASWGVGPFGRDYPFVWSSKDSQASSIIAKFGASAFGVTLQKPVTSYSMVERAQKYGVLFFVLVFAVFFLFEVTSPGLRIHPLQYAMVGAALALFFLGFLALSEFWSTATAYGAAAAACTLLVVLYAWSFLKTGRRTLVIGGGLGATYGYLYFVLQSQDYALVAGTAALFAALALVMYCTRRINWYSLEMNAASGRS